MHKALAYLIGLLMLGSTLGCVPVEEEADRSSNSQRQEKKQGGKQEAPPAPSMTKAEENAVAMAEQYLNTMPFSRTGLIEQLEFSGFSKADATFGTDYLGVDWMEQAALMAQHYLDTMAFSRDGLLEQLMFSGFTARQAEYGVSQVY